MRLKCLVTLALSILLVSSCAKQMPPPGGPEDKTPPAVIAFTPDSGSVFVDLKPDISVTFSERMNRETTAGAVFVSPPAEGEIHIDWKKNQLRLSFDEQLKIDRTYLITVGSGATDAHGNSMAESFTVAFSTGESLDSGSISGTVRSNALPISGATVVAYDLSLVDSLDPANRTPIYVTQSGADGRYALNYVAPASYLILAYEDKNRNKKWNPPGEGIGLPSIPAVVTDAIRLISEVDISLSQRDTVPLRVKSVSVSPDHVLKIALTESVLHRLVDSCKVLLVDSNGIAAIDVERLYAWADSTKDMFAPVILPPEQKDVRVRITNLEDIWENEIDTEADSVYLAVTPSQDKKKPSVVFSSPRSGDIVEESATRVVYRFDEPVNLASDSAGFRLIDVDSVPVLCSVDYPDPFSIAFTPHVELRQGISYAAFLSPEAVVDIAGNRGPDSSLVIHFMTLDDDTTGRISGHIRLNPAQTAQNPRVFIRAIPKGDWRKLGIEPDGRFSFGGLPGQYVLTGFLDRDGDGFRSPGRLRPFEYAEPIISITDTLAVRSRFDTENVEIQLR